MEEQPNYQPQQNLPEQPAPIKNSEKSSNKTLLITILLIVITALVAAGATWYYMDSKQKDQQSANQEQVEQLKTEVSTLKIQGDSIKPTTTPTPSSTDTKNELDKLRAYCQGTDPNTTVSMVEYYEYTNGKYGVCGIGTKGSVGGAMLVSVYQGASWIKIFSGNGTMDSATCVKYKVPPSVMTNCAGSY